MKKLIYILIFFCASMAMQAQFTKGISSATQVFGATNISISSTSVGANYLTNNAASMSFTTTPSARFALEGDSLNFQVDITGFCSGTIASAGPGSTYADSLEISLWLQIYTAGQATDGFSFPSSTMTAASSTLSMGIGAWESASTFTTGNTYAAPVTWIPVGMVPANNRGAWITSKSIARPGSALNGRLWVAVLNRRKDYSAAFPGVYLSSLKVWAIQRWNVVINK